MEEDRGASGVEYILLAALVVIVLLGAVSHFSSGLGRSALGAGPTTTTTAAVLGEFAVQGGADAAVWAGPEGARPLVLSARPGAGLALSDANRLLLDSVTIEGIAGVDVTGPAPDRPGERPLVVVGDGPWLRAYHLDPAGYRLEEAAQPLAAGVEVAGVCLHRDPAGAVSVFAFDAGGRMVESRLEAVSGGLRAKRSRTFELGGPAAACLADSDHQALFVSEPGRGLWRYDLSAPGRPAAVLVDRVGPGGGLVGSVDGLALVVTGPGTGWVLASSESDESFTFYRRGPGSVPAGRFPAAGRVDPCRDTTGIDARGAYLVCQSAAATRVVAAEDVTRLPAA